MRQQYLYQEDGRFKKMTHPTLHIHCTNSKHRLVRIRFKKGFDEYTIDDFSTYLVFNLPSDPSYIRLRIA